MKLTNGGATYDSPLGSYKLGGFNYKDTIGSNNDGGFK